jgi:hypothetical protein
MKRKYIFSLILIVGMIAGMTQTQAWLVYENPLTFGGNKIAFDISHGGYHTTEADLAPIIGNLTAAGNEVVYINDTWMIEDDWDAIFFTQPDDNYTVAELADIAAWFELGDKMMWVSGDSDYGGFFNPWAGNGILEAIGSIARLDGTSISDSTNNDGASYRPAATEIGYGDPLYDVVADLITTDSDTGLQIPAGVIFHGPCAVIAYDGTYYKDLRYGESVFPERVNVILTYSEDAISSDSDVSDGWGANTTAGDYGIDLYSFDVDTGLYPALVHEVFAEHTSDLIVSGEAIYTYYKFMYNQITENGVYNGGLHYGQWLVNSILNLLLEDKPVEETSAFYLVPLAVIGVIYAISRRKK